jgi:mono/diheme cytochrome c family protein
MRVDWAALCAAWLAFAIAAAVAQEPAAQQPDFDPAHAEKMQEGLSLFKSQVRQVLIDQCVECHGGTEVESGFDLATRKGLLRGGSHGKSVVAGKAEDSNLVRFIRHQEKPHMPDGGEKLPGEQIAAIARWIDLGAPYDRPLVENPRDPDAWTATVVPAKAREFWTFQPLQGQEPPPVKNEGWVKNPIDRFVLAQLEEKGLTPNPPANERVLVRRAWFDLLGLPPEGTEGERGQGGEGEKYGDLVDRLLESPHFGERWGRHWLDSARFAESHGFEQDYDRPYAYHFRDFVIQAFNQDMPYDQFVRWQLAGDELAPDEPLALMATGFLGAGVFPTQITANEVERTRYDALDDMAATTGSALLGLSIGCARCHDHKFDPIPQADYYRFISTFTTTVRSNIDVDMEPTKTKAALAEWEEQHAPKVAALAAYEKNHMPREFEKWMNESPQLDGSWRKTTEWIVFDKIEAKSKSGGTLTVQSDGAIVASGKNPDSDTYTLTTQGLDGLGTHIKTIRLEALPDPALVKSGPGRADNGNFAISRIRVFAEHADGSNRREIKLGNPRASFEQNGRNLSIAASLDDDPKTGWAVDPQFGQHHVAVFDTAEPIESSSLSGCRLVFELEFAVNTKHALGKLRLSCGYQGLRDSLAKEGAYQKQSVAVALNVIDGSG